MTYMAWLSLKETTNLNHKYPCKTQTSNRNLLKAKEAEVEQSALLSVLLRNWQDDLNEISDSVSTNR